MNKKISETPIGVMYVASKGYLGNNPIYSVEIYKRTDKCVWTEGGRRNSITSQYDNYFDTWQEAKDFLLSHHKAKVEQAISAFKYAAKNLRAVRKLKEPTEDGNTD